MKKYQKIVALLFAVMLCVFISSCEQNEINNTNNKAQETDINAYVGLSEEEKFQRIRSMFINAVSNGDTEIDIEAFGYTYEESQQVFDRLRYENPEYFTCMKDVRIHFLRNPSKFLKISWIFIDGVDVEQRVNWIRNEISKIADNIDDDWDDFQKALWINNWLFYNVKYDESLNSRNIYSLLKDNIAVCEGLTSAYYLIGKECGLNVSYVSSKTKKHVWNTVCINGEWYNVDLTINIRERSQYMVFLMSDERYRILTGGTVGENRRYECLAKNYDESFWSKTHATGSMIMINGEIYIASSYSVKKLNNSTMKLETYIKKKATTETWHDESGFGIRGAGYVDITPYKDGFLYSTKSEITYYNTVTGEKQSVYKNTSGPDIYGVRYEDGIITIKTYNDFPNNQFVISAVTSRI